MKKTISKTGAKEKIEKFFGHLENKMPKDVKKIKRLAMSHRIPLTNYKKLFCKKCFAVYKNPKIRIRNKTKILRCENCDYISRWKI